MTARPTTSTSPEGAGGRDLPPLFDQWVALRGGDPHLSSGELDELARVTRPREDGGHDVDPPAAVPVVPPTQ